MSRPLTSSFFQEIQWTGESNGKTAQLDIEINDNGKKKKKSTTLDNSDFMKLLNYHPDPYSLDKRLEIDYLLKQTTSKSKNKKSKNKKSKNKTKKIVKVDYSTIV